ncbi:hypothetical protein ACROYT_G003095 [Oculina patagonica]
MKFTEHLGAHLTPEWRSQYIRYEISPIKPSIPKATCFLCPMPCQLRGASHIGDENARQPHSQGFPLKIV